MSRNDIEYYRRRAISEREAANAASQPNIAAIHLELAEHYEAIVRLHDERENSRPACASRELPLPSGKSCADAA